MQQTVTDKVPNHLSRRAAAELRRLDPKESWSGRLTTF